MAKVCNNTTKDYNARLQNDDYFNSIISRWVGFENFLQTHSIRSYYYIPMQIILFSTIKHSRIRLLSLSFILSCFFYIYSFFIDHQLYIIQHNKVVISNFSTIAHICNYNFQVFING